MFKGIFGGLFDLNNDGEIDTFERAAELSFLEQITAEEENESSDSFEDDSDFDFDGFDD